MPTFIEEYIEIENNLRNHRKKGQLLAQLFAKYPGIAHTPFDDLLVMLEQLKHSKAKIRMPLFAQLIYPVLEREIESGNLQAIKVMVQYISLLNSYNSMMKMYDKYSDITLINRYLQRDPGDREILMRKEAFQGDFLEFALHEVPWGVLYGMNGATKDQCLDLQDLLEEYKMTCQKLQIDRSDFTRYAAMHFQGYRDYLLHRDLYKRYRDYCQQHDLALPKMRNYYYTPKAIRKC